MGTREMVETMLMVVLAGCLFFYITARWSWRRLGAGLLLYFVGGMTIAGTVGFLGPPLEAERGHYRNARIGFHDLASLRTSHGLSSADVAWHAVNTYGWPCENVIARESTSRHGADYLLTCSNGTRLLEYSRADAHPRITNIDGNYK